VSFKIDPEKSVQDIAATTVRRAERALTLTETVNLTPSLLIRMETLAKKVNVELNLLLEYLVSNEERR
jgi:hypothetical protein